MPKSNMRRWLTGSSRGDAAKRFGVPRKCAKAVACLIKDRDVLLAFHDFSAEDPAEPWKHPRTANPIESSIATVRHRRVRSKGCLSNKTTLAMIFKLAEAAANPSAALRAI